MAFNLNNLIIAIQCVSVRQRLVFIANAVLLSGYFVFLSCHTRVTYYVFQSTCPRNFSFAFTVVNLIIVYAQDASHAEIYQVNTTSLLVIIVWNLRISAGHRCTCSGNLGFTVQTNDRDYTYRVRTQIRDVCTRQQKT